MTGSDPTIADVDVGVYTVPTDGPEADGTLEWSATTMVLVQVTADTATGTGWTYGPPACASVVAHTLADVVTGRHALDPPACFEAMVEAIRNQGRPGVVSMAISAVDNALWDLKARLLGLPLHRLLGAVRDEVPVYGSGGFTTYDDQQLTHQLESWLEAGCRQVKIKIGESWGTRVERDIARLTLAREVIGDDVELFADANGGYSAKQAIRFHRRVDALNVCWLEEPVSSDDLPGLRRVREAVDCDVTAGEYGYDLAYFQRMCAAEAVDCVQVDVTRCGGITEWLRIAALAAAHQLTVSGHCAPTLHAPVAAAVANLRHVEWFHDHVRLESMLFEGAGQLQDGRIRLREAPGNGVSLREADAQRHRVA